tara:strand:- start:254 stop:631 length:378 start_codon:yes stop_codon:yes gene_type:complete
MSTLKVNTIQDASGSNSSTAEQIAQGRAKAWVNFNGTGTVAIRESFNISSITDEATGRYTINIENALPTANYAVANMAGNYQSTTTSNTSLNTNGTRTATAFNVRAVNGSSSTADKADLNVIFFA